MGEEHFITTFDGIELKAHIQEVGAPTWLVGVHGVGEHWERHGHLGELFLHDFNLLQYDLRGHGESGGRPIYVEDFWDYMKDLACVLSHLKKRYGMKNFVLFGHSMGALIVSGFLQRMAHKSLYPKAVFLNAPPVGFPGAMGKVVDFLPLFFRSGLAGLPLSVRLKGLVNLDFLSHDTRIKDAYKRDPKNHLSLHSKLVFEMLKASCEVFAKPLKPQCPAFASVGTQDKVVEVGAFLNYFAEVEKNFVVKKIEGAYHEIHNEVERFRAPYFDFLKKSLMESLR